MLERARWTAPVAVVLALAGGCGGRSDIAPDPPLPRDAAVAEPVELCNGADDDSDGRIDEGFRDGSGLYTLSVEHCGACDQACGPIEHATGVECRMVEGLGTLGCAARDCETGFAPTTSGGCAEPLARVCLPCRADVDCGSVIGAVCALLGTESHCTVDCALGCPPGHVCQSGLCAPAGGSCDCTTDAAFELGCMLTSDAGVQCVGRQRCDDGRLSACELPEESCNGVDDDCDDRVDEGFVDRNGAYGLDDRHCGSCGVDCTRDSAGGMALVCGGDPFAPSCAVHCVDGDDGVQVGDELDADGRIDTGCECTVSSMRDSGGRPASEGGQLDSDCDGADGTVLDSIYVAVNGDDSGPGSPTQPLRSINAAIERAAGLIGGPFARSQVYVAAGTYTESVVMRDGVELRGGYRRDYLDLSASGFEVVIQAPADSAAYGGAALVLSDVGTMRTVVEGLTLRGVDAADAGQPALGVLIERPGPELYLRELRVRAGRPGSGMDGVDGDAGSGVASAATAGEPPRAATENAAHQCLASDANRVRGGRAGQNVCGGRNVGGGAGGSPGCPDYGGPQQPSGSAGRASSSAAGGPGGAGGYDLIAPLLRDTSSCPAPPCCGLADFTVPCIDVGTGVCEFPQPGAGGNGADGAAGAAGAACGASAALGGFVDGRWQPGTAQGGTPGDAGAGGGGGGAGAGIEFQWTAPACQFADGLAGAGGGGGAGGCGGTQGLAGSSGGPAIGVLIVAHDANALPHLHAVRVESEDGARGGDGGAGGDGGPGGSGGSGGDLPIADKTTPSTAGPLPGQRGGRGGNGGAGGAGGGGCGGAVVGVWLTGLGQRPALGAAFMEGNDFTGLGQPGRGGAGGGGAVPAAAGHDGEAFDVLIR